VYCEGQAEVASKLLCAEASPAPTASLHSDQEWVEMRAQFWKQVQLSSLGRPMRPQSPARTESERSAGGGSCAPPANMAHTPKLCAQGYLAFPGLLSDEAPYICAQMDEIV
jgi:hypothetical protein